jgi:hypothetical protein
MGLGMAAGSKPAPGSRTTIPAPLANGVGEGLTQRHLDLEFAVRQAACIPQELEDPLHEWRDRGRVAGYANPETEPSRTAGPKGRRRSAARGSPVRDPRTVVGVVRARHRTTGNAVRRIDAGRPCMSKV